MNSFQCPYCSMIIPCVPDTYQVRYPSFDRSDDKPPSLAPFQFDESTISISFCKCPNCGQYTIQLHGKGKAIIDTNCQVRPHSLAKQFPNYIPSAIRSDYEEACAIVSLSPKASATLSRRCLQGMIHDFWDIKLKNLNQEITALKDKIPADLWASIDALRQLGNIGAHMEKDTNVIVDIDPSEAESLIKLIELLMKEWYINRADHQKLFGTIISTNESKQSERKKTE